VPKPRPLIGRAGPAPTARLDQQRDLLAATTDDNPQALALITDSEPTTTLHAVPTRASAPP
jgi:hypothetical protein